MCSQHPIDLEMRKLTSNINHACQLRAKKNEPSIKGKPTQSEKFLHPSLSFPHREKRLREISGISLYMLLWLVTGFFFSTGYSAFSLDPWLMRNCATHFLNFLLKSYLRGFSDRMEQFNATSILQGISEKHS